MELLCLYDMHIKLRCEAGTSNGGFIWQKVSDYLKKIRPISKIHKACVPFIDTGFMK